MTWNSAFGNRGVLDVIAFQFSYIIYNIGELKVTILKNNGPEKQTGSRLKCFCLYTSNKNFWLMSKFRTFRAQISKKTLRSIDRRSKNKHSNPIIVFQFFNVLYIFVLVSSMKRFQGNYFKSTTSFLPPPPPHLPAVRLIIANFTNLWSFWISWRNSESRKKKFINDITLELVPKRNIKYFIF